MTFSKKDSALRDKAGSLWLASSIDTQVLSPCSPLHNPAFSSQILESQNGFTKQAQNLESTFQQSSHSPTAIPRILEEESQANQSSLRADNALFPSLRDFALAVAWQSNSAPAESNQINSTREACNLESVQGDWGAKGVKKEGGGGDKGGRFASSPPVPP